VSLINKMLQDLDGRSTPGAAAADLYSKPVARMENRPPLPVLIGGAAAVVVLAVGGALAWHYLQKPAAEVAPQPVKVVMTAPSPVSMTVTRHAVPPASASASAVEDEPEQTPVVTEKAPRPAEPKAMRAPAAPKPAAAAPKPAQKAKAVAAAQGTAREENPAQRAEAAYRNALNRLQEGWVSDAVVSLEQALQINPRHDAARQTLVGLLMENKRFDDAMRHLQAALALDPRQSAMAMLLARLQIERGGSGIETLTRTLPYAGGDGEYLAFLAGALQRQQRHGEAAEQYQAALRSAPHNGVWWMGLGISLQAEKRDAQALEAFRNAKGTGSLNAELLAFVERKIQQLSR